MLHDSADPTIWLLRSTIGDLPFDDLLETLKRVAGRIDRIHLSDLVAPKPEVSNGLYFFFEDSTLMYVGVSGSRALVERIPAHFDTREAAYMNVIPKRLVARAGMSDLSAAVSRMRGFKVALIFDDGDGDDLAEVESVLRHVYSPVLNPQKKPKGYAGTVNEYWLVDAKKAG